MLFGVFLGFVLTTGVFGGLLWLGFRRVSRHLQGNAEAVKHVADHVLIPLLGRKPEEAHGQMLSQAKTPPQPEHPNLRPLRP